MTSVSIPPSARLSRLLACIELDAGNLLLRKDAIREACDTGQWDMARKLIEYGLETHPADAGLLALRGLTCLHAQRYADAEQALSAALALGLEAPEIQYNLAFAQFMQKNFADALERLTPPGVSQGLPRALLLRARCLHHLGRPAEAIADCNAHLALVPGDAETHGLLGLLLYEQEQTEAAKEHIEVALRQSPNQLEAMLALASIQSDSQEYDSARRSFDALLRAHPQCGRGWLGLGLIELTQARAEAAQRDIELAAEHMPDHVGTWHVLAWIHIIRGDVLGAEYAFSQAMVLDRNFGETHGGMAVVAALQGREADARASIRRALRLNPESMSVQYARLLLLQQEGRHEESQAVLKSFLERPVARSDMQYRDLVRMRIKYLGAGVGEHSGSVLRH